MDDTIYRQAAIDAVETKIKKWNAVDGEGYHVGLGLRYTDVIDTLTELPSAQLEIVRCKNCKHGMYDMMCKFYWCHGVAHSANWYCADAERITNDLQ